MSFIKIMLRVVPIQFKSAPLHCMLNTFTSTIHALSWTVTIIATQSLFDTIVDAAAGSADFWDCLPPLLILAAIIFGREIMNGVDNFHAFDVWYGKLTGKLLDLLHRKLQRIDPAQFEDTDFLDNLNKAREGAKAIPYFASSIFLIFSFYGVYFASIGAYLFSLKPELLIYAIDRFHSGYAGKCAAHQSFHKIGRTERTAAPGMRILPKNLM